MRSTIPLQFGVAIAKWCTIALISFSICHSFYLIDSIVRFSMLQTLATHLMLLLSPLPTKNVQNFCWNFGFVMFLKSFKFSIVFSNFFDNFDFSYEFDGKYSTLHYFSPNFSPIFPDFIEFCTFPHYELKSILLGSSDLSTFSFSLNFYRRT